MIFEAFKNKHIEDAASLAITCYKKERLKVPELPEPIEASKICDMLSDMTAHSLGVAAIEGSTLMGFLTCYSPLKNYFGTSDGVFSPIHAHGAVQDSCSEIYSMLYQHAAKIWVGNGLLSHVVALYAHDDEIVHSFYYNGFGLRCVDAIRPLEKIHSDKIDGVSFEACMPEDYKAIAEFENMLLYHLRSSPMFMPRNPNKDEKSIERAINEKGSRFFVAKSESCPIGFIEISDEGENFACDTPDMKNICGAYLMPEYRTRGIFTSLLSHVIEVLISKGYKRLGVDYESFNPTANAFWSKYFTPYTFSVARRIDERIISVS